MPSQTTSSLQGFPQSQSPIVVQGTGILTSQWYNFFVNLWTRSGVSQGGVLVPSGQTVFFLGPVANIPSGWLLCDGSSLSQTTYASLFAAIGKTWGGVGNLTFNLPDFRGKILLGADGNHPVGTYGSLGYAVNGGNPLPQYAAINYIVKT